MTREADIAQSIWSANERLLTFGTPAAPATAEEEIAAAVWAYADRSLTVSRPVRLPKRVNPILSMEEILYVASNLGRDSDAPHLWRGLVGAWPLQEPGGVTAFDVSGYGRHGTLTNGPTRGVGNLGRHVQFAGGTDHILGPQTISSLPLTLACWFRPASEITQADALLAVGNTASNSFHELIYAGDQVGDPIIAATYDGTTYGQSKYNTGGAAGVWHHAAGTFAAANLRTVYYDGKPGTPNTDTSSPSSFPATTIGRRAWTSANAFAGKIAFGGVWNRLLSTAEIQQLYADPWAMYRKRKTYFPVAVAPQTKKLYWPRKSNRRNPILSMEEILHVASNLGRDSEAPHLWRGLVGSWPLQEPGGVTAFDVSGYGNNGTLTSLDPSTDRIVTTKGRAVDFLATSSQWINCGNSSRLNPTGAMTLMAWAQLTIGAEGAHWLIARDVSTGRAYAFGVQNRKVCLQINGAGTINLQAGQSLLTTGTLYHIAAIGSPSTGWNTYVNGQPDGGTAAWAACNATTNATNIGRREYSGFNGYCTGWITLPTIYARALSLSELQSHVADPWAMYRLRKKTAHFFLHTGPRVVDAAFSNDSPFDVSESIGTVTATDAIGAKTWEIVSQTQE